MSWLEAIVLGIVQGLTEFLPISSSAHLSIVGQLFFKGHDPGAAFTAVSQLGTETAVLIYFRKDIARIIRHWFGSFTGKYPKNDPDVRMGWLVIIGSIPIVVFGLLFEDWITTYLRNLWITATMLAIFSLVIARADKVARNKKELSDLTWKDGIIYGLCQAMALIPGVSRSGATIAGGLIMGYKREVAARYAFLLAIPAVFGSGLYQLKDVAATAASPDAASWAQIIVATVIAFIIGMAVIHWLLKFISHNTFLPFVWYRLGLSALVILLLITGVLSPLGG